MYDERSLRRQKGNTKNSNVHQNKNNNLSIKSTKSEFPANALNRYGGQTLYFFRLHGMNGVFNNNDNNNIRELDLVLTATENCDLLKVSKSDEEDANHPASLIDIELEKNQSGGDNIYFETETFYNFQKCDFLQLSYKGRDIDWTILLEIENVNDAVDFSQSEIFGIFNDLVPQMKDKRSKFPVWFTKDVNECLKRKNELRKLKNLTNYYMRLYVKERQT
ncbi:hypothetical protein JTB14_003278 [Gonioctena quinquepunctata]|nr:hypothetical protein JTB14_003278 [Gonioctena quinquepunctata]